METINLKAHSTEKCSTLDFDVATGPDNKYYAYRETPPYFCFEGSSKEEVIEVVEKAVDLLRRNRYI